jgi:indolepyruvate ferredoxin oxidoreductase beta subunit
VNAIQTTNMVVAALGGEGGGVFTNWVIEVAEREGWLCQTTSLAGVAQRTGATIYYLEFFPRAACIGALPVMSLFPAQGDIDIAVASEIAEAGRMVQRGFVTADRTTLIASDHRVYGITEKVDLGDGAVDAEQVREIASSYAKDYIHFDMAAVASEHGAVISAVMLGALAGSGALPFSKECYVAVIEASGRAVQTNLAAFAASYERARGRGVETYEPEPEPAFTVPMPTTAAGGVLLERLATFPAACHEVMYHGLEKLVDYQDYAYAELFLDRLQALQAAGSVSPTLLEAVARYLALWMCFEDVPRVAQLKIRQGRWQEIATEVAAAPGQLFDVTEYFKPRVEEICALLPPALARAILASDFCRGVLNRFTGGRQLRTNTLVTFTVLRSLAGLRRWRRFGYGYQHENALIERWLQALSCPLPADPGLALEVALCGRIIKGYGATRQRTSSQLSQIFSLLDNGSGSAEQVAQWRAAALADDAGLQFASVIADG